jgi:predicted nucleic acid-binding protein
MATRVVERALLDTNVLLAATDEARDDHRAALSVLDRWPTRGTVLYTSGQILREYLCVATRPPSRNGLGLDRRDALANVHALRDRLRLLDESLKVADRLLALLDEVPCTGKQVHDANVVATMVTHGVGVLVTRNVDDFARFAAHIRTVDPAGRTRR